MKIMSYQIIGICALLSYLNICAMDETKKPYKAPQPTHTLFSHLNVQKQSAKNGQHSGSSESKYDESSVENNEKQSSLNCDEKKCSARLLTLLRTTTTSKEEEKKLADFWKEGCSAYPKARLFRGAHYYGVKEVAKKGYSEELEHACFRAAAHADYHENWWKKNITTYGPIVLATAAIVGFQFIDKIPGVNRVFEFVQGAVGIADKNTSDNGLNTEVATQQDNAAENSKR